MNTEFESSADRVVIIGGGPGGYEAALVAAQLGADVMLIERNRCGGAAVLTDVVPSKSLIATAEMMEEIARSESLGIRIYDSEGDDGDTVVADLKAVNKRILSLADAQANDIYEALIRSGVKVIQGTATLADRDHVNVVEDGGTEYTLEASTILLSVGSHPRELDSAKPDGERILTWTQLYDLDELPEHLIVVGSGVTGAEFASAYHALGTKVTLVSSREKVLPGQDEDAADVLEFVFRNKGMNVLSRSRADSVKRTENGVEVTLSDGRRVEGSHCLMAVGSIPNTEGLGLSAAKVKVKDSGHIKVDGVSRTSRSGVYAAGDCTGVFPLASVAAMQGRIAMFHALGDAVQPLKIRHVASNVFTAPEIATVGFTQSDYRENSTDIDTVMLPLDTNPRAKMLGIKDGFVKLFARRGSGSILGGVVVGPRASELILPITMAVENRLTVDQLSASFVVYPSVSGSLTEASRQLHRHL